jgi:hypothetical protein
MSTTPLRKARHASRLHRQGLTYSQIAQVLGYTNSASAGSARHYGERIEANIYKCYLRARRARLWRNFK